MSRRPTRAELEGAMWDHYRREAPEDQSLGTFVSKTLLQVCDGLDLDDDDRRFLDWAVRIWDMDAIAGMVRLLALARGAALPQEVRR